VPRAALEALIAYLSDRRQKLTGAINALPAPGLPAESSLPPLSSLPSEALHQLPNLPYTEMEPETLLRVAQVIYTGLLKVYLVARPILVGSLCRIANWCDVEEVEELLKAQSVSPVLSAASAATGGCQLKRGTENTRSDRFVSREKDARQGSQDAP
jgi:hypothetical protein